MTLCRGQIPDSVRESQRHHQAARKGRLATGRSEAWHETVDAGKGAAVGRLWGTLGKVVIAAIMWLVVTAWVIGSIFWA